MSRAMHPSLLLYTEVTPAAERAGQYVSYRLPQSTFNSATTRTHPLLPTIDSRLDPAPWLAVVCFLLLGFVSPGDVRTLDTQKRNESPPPITVT